MRFDGIQRHLAELRLTKIFTKQSQMRRESAQYICAITSVVTLRNLPTSGSIKKIGTVKDNV